MPLIFLLLILVSNAVFAQKTPTGSSFDSRMQRVPYNVEDVTKVNARLGFVTTVIFAEDEVVEKAIAGFAAGWSIIPYQNKLFISPIPVEQESETEGEVVRQKFEPQSGDWQTNLFVSTNKRSYSMDLNLLSSENYAHIVRYWYPEAEKAYRNKQEIAASLYKANLPLNWHYYFKMSKDSENIVPDFAYDDGSLTYLGFSEGKSFPSVFLLNNGKEQIINYSVRQKDNYKVMVIHKLNQAFVLRYGKQAVGILNKSFGQYVRPYSSTNSALVKREEINE